MKTSLSVFIFTKLIKSILFISILSNRMDKIILRVVFTCKSQIIKEEIILKFLKKEDPHTKSVAQKSWVTYPVCGPKVGPHSQPVTLHSTSNSDTHNFFLSFIKI
jgi:hypothetical protein